VTNYLNTYFDVVIAAAFPKLLTEIVQHYYGRILIRVFGRETPHSYSDYLKTLDSGSFWSSLAEISHRFWLAASYITIPEIEDSLLKTRSVILPLGIPKTYIPHKLFWQGNVKKVLFVCPRIASHAFYYGKVYEDFKENLGEFPYLVAGYQPVKVDDPNVIGFVSDDVYRALFKDLALMFYHSREPRHLHYHPLEAIACGMPVIYMRGGLMEMFGGQEQPGACKNYLEAHEKIQRILDGDTEFIKAIQKSQLEIIKSFKWAYCRNEWQKIFLGQIMTSDLEL
jgi:glycosyltransferase involved in cell wall biosynthesis